MTVREGLLRVAAVAAVTMFLGLLAAIGLFRDEAGVGQGTTEMVVVMDRAHPQTTRQLLAESQLVVVGNLGDQNEEYGRSTDGSIIHVGTEFVVTKVLRGEVAVGERLLVARSLTASGLSVVEDGTEPLQPGRSYLLLLRRAEVDTLVSKSAIYSSPGGPQGQFALIDGRLRPLDPSQPTANSFRGKTDSDVMAIVSSAER